MVLEVLETWVVRYRCYSMLEGPGCYPVSSLLSGDIGATRRVGGGCLARDRLRPRRLLGPYRHRHEVAPEPPRAVLSRHVRQSPASGTLVNHPRAANAHLRCELGGLDPVGVVVRRHGRRLGLLRCLRECPSSRLFRASISQLLDLRAGQTWTPLPRMKQAAADELRHRARTLAAEAKDAARFRLRHPLAIPIWHVGTLPGTPRSLEPLTRDVPTQRYPVRTHVRCTGRCRWPAAWAGRTTPSRARPSPNASPAPAPGRLVSDMAPRASTARHRTRPPHGPHHPRLRPPPRLPRHPRPRRVRLPSRHVDRPPERQGPFARAGSTPHGVGNRLCCCNGGAWLTAATRAWSWWPRRTRLVKAGPSSGCGRPRHSSPPSDRAAASCSGSVSAREGDVVDHVLLTGDELEANSYPLRRVARQRRPVARWQRFAWDAPTSGPPNAAN